MIFKEFKWWPGTESVVDRVLKTHNLLILQTDKKDKTDKKPIPLYVYCTVNTFRISGSVLTGVCCWGIESVNWNTVRFSRLSESR